MKKIISYFLTVCLILSLAPAVYADETVSADPGFGKGNLIFDYNLTADFAETPLGKAVIAEDFDIVADGFDATYSDEGITITRHGTSTASTPANKFGLNLVGAIEKDDANNTVVYQTGFSGVYAIEITMDVGYTVGDKRTDMYFNARKCVGTGAVTSANNFRIHTHNVSYYNGATDGRNVDKWKAGEDWVLRFVIDTINGKIYSYNVDSEGNYAYKVTAPYTGNTITSVSYSPRLYVADGQYMTFKNIKLYEIERDINAQGNASYESFVNALPTSIVDDPYNVTESFEMPDSLAYTGTVTSSNSAFVQTNGVVTQGFEDRNEYISVAADSSGIYYEKLYNLLIKARSDIDVKELSDFDYSTEKDSASLVAYGDGAVDAEGYKVINTNAGAGVVGLLDTVYSADDNCAVYYRDHDGASDFEVTLTPELTSGEAYVEVGNYNDENGEFTTFGKVRITPENIVYCDAKEDVVAITEATFGNEYSLKYRVFVDEGKIWLWVNSKIVAELPFSYSSDKLFNAFKVSMDNAGAEDTILIKNSKLTQQIPSDNADVAESINALLPLSVYSIANPTDAYGEINLPEVSGYDVEWYSNSPLADLEREYIYRTDEDTDITLSAVISPANDSTIKVSKEFYVTVLGTDDPEYLLEGALAKLTPESITNQNPAHLVADIALPEVSGEGYAITWDSMNDDIISDKGIINKNINISEDTDVVLKATLVAGGNFATKDVEFTVAKRGMDISLNPSDLSGEIKNVVTYKTTVANSDGYAYLRDANGNRIIGFEIADSKLSFDYKNSDGKKYNITADNVELKFVMNSADDKVSVLIDGVLVLDYVPYLTAVNGFANVDTNLALNNSKIVLDEYSLIDYNIDYYKYFDIFANMYINDDVSLKTTSIGGVDVKWTSSNKNILSDSGAYTTPELITQFAVTVNMSVNGGSGAKFTKAFNCVAVPDEETNLFKNADVMTNMNEDIANDKSKAFDNNFDTYFAATKLTSKSQMTIDMGVLKDINSLYFFRNGEDNNLISCDIYVSKDGKTWGDVIASPVFSDYSDNHVVFEMQNARYVRISNINSLDKTLKLYEVKGYVSYSSDDKAHFDIMALNMPDEYILTADKLTLPAEGPLYGSKLTWKSNDTSVISLDGKVTKPEKKTEVVLTVTAEFEGKTSVKSFIYLVNGKASSGGASGGGGGGGSANVSGVHTGGAGMAALPTKPQVEETETVKFSDVNTSDWYYEYVTELTEKGIINGYEDGSFKPSNKVTREEFVKMLISATKTNVVNVSAGFSDVDMASWYAPYVNTAKYVGMVNGIDDSNFGIGLNISRQDMAVMIYNVLDVNKDIDAQAQFNDAESISDYAYKAVCTLSYYNVVNGYENGNFEPYNTLTRAEAAKVISIVLSMLK